MDNIMQLKFPHSISNYIDDIDCCPFVSIRVAEEEEEEEEDWLRVHAARLL